MSLENSLKTVTEYYVSCFENISKTKQNLSQHHLPFLLLRPLLLLLLLLLPCVDLVLLHQLFTVNKESFSWLWTIVSIEICRPGCRMWSSNVSCLLDNQINCSDLHSLLKLSLFHLTETDPLLRRVSFSARTPLSLCRERGILPLSDNQIKCSDLHLLEHDSSIMSFLLYVFSK